MERNSSGIVSTWSGALEACYRLEMSLTENQFPWFVFVWLLAVCQEFIGHTIFHLR